MVWFSVSQTFLFSYPLFTLNTLLSSPSLMQQTQGNIFKEFYL